MNAIRITPSNYLIAGIAAAVALLAALDAWVFNGLALEPAKVSQGEVWRIFTCNFVHFGWVHALMNLAAFVLCGLALFSHTALPRFITLLCFCCVVVGSGVYLLNPEYDTYAGLSGVLHGLIVAGLLVNKRHPYWVNAVFIALTFAKIFHEQQAGHNATQLQELLPVAVAYDAHLYGAVAGLVFGVACLIKDRSSKSL